MLCIYDLLYVVSNVVYDSMLHYFQATFLKQVTHIILPHRSCHSARYQVCNGPLASPIAKLTVMLGMEKHKPDPSDEGCVFDIFLTLYGFYLIIFY